jgi:transcriptional regulator of arginine metabolism
MSSSTRSKKRSQDLTLSRNKDRGELRLDFLRDLLVKGEPSSQEELVQKLEKASFHVTQSTVSRDLRKLGAVRTVDRENRTVYRLDEANKWQSIPEPVVTGMQKLVEQIHSNGYQIVLRTQPGSASLIARFLDSHFNDEILGTIAGDDTIFVAPKKVPIAPQFIRMIESAIMNMEA